jgi:SAM-dependent methyltransferase
MHRPRDAGLPVTSRTSRRPLPVVSVALVSAAALAYEVLLMRLFSIIQWHHFAYMIISLALLGYGASGTFIALAGPALLRRFERVYWSCLMLFGLSAVACGLLAQRIPFNAEEVLWDWHQPLRLLMLYLLLSLPFFFAANGIALALTRFRKDVPRIYAADLLGAGAGSLGIVLLLFVVFPGTALQIIGALGLLAALVASRELQMTQRRWPLLALLGAAVLISLPGAWLELQISPYKGLPQTLRIGGTRIIEERSSPLGLLTLVDSRRIPLRHAPGLSLYADTPIPEQLGLFTDADSMTAINHNPGHKPLPYLDWLTSALPYYLAEPEQVLVLGAGGGAEVQQALNHDVPRIDAVELNPQVIELVSEDFAGYAGRLYQRPGVRVHSADARGFIRESRERYDLIQISLLDAFGASSAGLYSLNENYLYTVEALQDYLQRLNPGGYLAISRWIKLPPRDSLKLYATALRALREAGAATPQRQLALIRSWQTGTLLVKNGVFTAREIADLRAFCAARAFDVAWYPGMTETEANQVNVLEQPYFFQAATALNGGDAAGFMARYKFNIEPATDDRPYFFHFFKWAVLPEILALRGQGGLPLLESGYLVMVATLLQAALISGLFILLPLGLRRWEPGAQSFPLRRDRIVVYFFAIGLAFLFIEIAFIQTFILFLDHPLYAVATVLTAFLLFAGLGSASIAHFRKKTARPSRLAGKAVAGIIGLGIAYSFLLGPLCDSLMILPLALRVIVSILLIAPLAFCMGMPFPLGLERIGAEMPGFIPWAWGINGCASVVSAVMASLLAIQFGFTVVIISALLLYLVAALTFP